MQSARRSGVAGQSEFARLEPDVRLRVVGRTAYVEGSVPSYERKKSLSRIVERLPGVDRVVNRLCVAPSCHRADEAVTQAVLAALGRNHLLRLEDISVSAAEGVVELRGAVPGISSRVAAEAIAWSVTGVRHVHNRLELARGAHAGSAAVAEELRQGLLSTLGAAGVTSIDLTYRRGVVRLRGGVAGADERLAAEDWLRWHPMVRRVVNELAVETAGR